MGKILFFVGLVILLVIIAPLATIWALNTLFGLVIPFTFETWLAALVLFGALANRK